MELEKLYTNSSNSDNPQYEFVLQVHDEFTIECDEDIAEEVGRISSACIKLAGERLGIKVPLEAKPAIGKDWYEIH